MTEPVLHPDYKDMLSALSGSEAEFLLVGSHAMAVHGVPRYTEDIDILIRPSIENAHRVYEALIRFGAPADLFRLNDLLEPDTVIQIGVRPVRIDLLTGITGVSFDEAWSQHTSVKTQEGLIPVIGLKALLRNKRATGRKQDEADAERLEKHHGFPPHGS